MSAVAPLEVTTVKKHKKDKSAKKRAREDEAPGEAPPSERKHKRSKSVAIEESQDEPELPPLPPPTVNDEEPKKEKKEKKQKKSKKHDTNGLDGVSQESSVAAPKSSKKKNKEKRDAADDEPVPETNGQSLDASDKKEKKKRKKSKLETEANQADNAASQPTEVLATQDPDTMDVDTEPAAVPTPKSSSSKIYAPPDIPPEPQFPFFTQTVSLYEPLLPSGWSAPIAGCESQHLRHLHNRYVPSLRGVLLDYSRVTLNDKPGRDGGATTDEEPALLTSKGEFGGGFGWITADVRLFVPSRGAWMEGSVNLQTEGHIGVVCFGKFNASIEASRLLSSWKWIPNEQAENGFEETASVITAGADEHGVVRQINSTGYWADSFGDKIKGRIRFRIRNFDVGVNGNSTFLSLQGTMLDKKREKELVVKEAEQARSRKQRRDGKQGRKNVPEFSMTRFDNEDEADAPFEGVVTPALEELATTVTE